MTDQAADIDAKPSLEHVPLIPAQAGIQSNKRRSLRPWIPAFAGMSGNAGIIPLPVMIELAWLAGMILIAIFANLIAPYSFTTPDLRNRLAPPGNPLHLLGSDELGCYVLSRLIVSIRFSLLIAFGASIISAVFGTALGFLAAYFRGLVEQVVLMLADFQASMPFLILALSVLAFFGNSLA